MQVSPAPQVNPQAPQLAGSLASEAHWPLQVTWSEVQTTSVLQAERAAARRSAATAREVICQFSGEVPMRRVTSRVREGRG